jgi:polyisoprenoid-binding protein YceI
MKAVVVVLIGLAVAGSIVGSAAGAENPCVVAGRGHFHIHTDAGGLFGAFAHEHLIEAQKIEGCAAIDSVDLMRSSIKLTFKTANIRVMDPKESESTRSKVQSTMDSDVLRTSEFPDVVFQSTGIERGSVADAFRVRGNLTIRGKTQAITVPLTMTHLDDGTYRAKGEYTLKQTSFGIQPVRVAGGTVKVKDEVRVEFEMFLK